MKRSNLIGSRQLTFFCKRPQEKGQAIVFIATVFGVLLIFMAFVVDLGVLGWTRHVQQNIVDAAALSGSGLLPDEWAAKDEGAPYFAQNRNLTVDDITELETVGNTTHYQIGNHAVDITTPYLKVGSSIPPENLIQVVARWEVPATFARIMGHQTFTVENVAAARHRATGLLCGGDVIILHPTAPKAFEMGGGAQFSTNGNLFVNSSAKNAMSITGTGTSVSASNILLTGGYFTGGGINISPDPLLGQAPLADPFAGLPLLIPATVRSSEKLNLSGGVHTLNPGLYAGEVTISGSAVVTFLPGFYYLVQGLSVSHSNIQGKDVVLFNRSGRFLFNGNCQLNMFAPTDGNFQDLLLWQAPANTKKITFNGNMQGIHGGIYAPDGLLELTGGTFDASNAGFVVNRMAISGDAQIVVDADGVIVERIVQVNGLEE